MSVTTTHAPVVLEPESQEFVEATSTPPFLYELTPAEARKVLDDVQAAPIDKLAVEDRWLTVPADVGDVRVRIVRPPDAPGTYSRPVRLQHSCREWRAHGGRAEEAR